MENQVNSECLEYLVEKIENLNLNKDVHGGFRILRTIHDLDKTQIKKFLKYGILRLYKKFKEDKVNKLPYSVPLTSYIMNVGSYVLETFQVEGLEYTKDKDILHKERGIIGGAILEPLVKFGYVEIAPDKSFPVEGRMKPPNKIYALDKWVNGSIFDDYEMAYAGKSLSPIKNTTSLRDGRIGFSVVKHKYDEDYFKEMLGTDFVHGVDHLQSVKWAINPDMFEIINNNMTFKNSKDVKIPKSGSKVAVENARKELEVQSKLMKKEIKNNVPLENQVNTYEKAKKDFERASKVWQNKRKYLKEKSHLKEIENILRFSKLLLNEKKFYMQVSADYRGRYYYDSPFLNYQGSDIAKSLLEFHDGRLITESGLKWLKIYAASNYNQTYTKEELSKLDWTSEDYVSYLNKYELDDISIDKMSLKDREKWADVNLWLIIETAEKGNRLDEAEKPYLFLATCIDLFKYYQAKERGEDYYSYLPVAVDGSCNGVQHAAAMNRDKETGELVGLVPSNIPKDIYMITGKNVRDMQEDYFNQRSNMRMKDIRKNFSKIAVMCRSYSAGWKSISEGMFGECHKNGATDKFNITPEDCNMLAKTSIQAIDETCPSTETTRSFLSKVLKHELGEFEYFNEFGELDSNRMGKIKSILKSNNQLLGAIKKTCNRIENGEFDKSSKKCKFAYDFIFKSLKMKPIDDTNEFYLFIKEKRETLEKENSKLYEERIKLKPQVVKGNRAKSISWITPSGFKVDYSHFMKSEDDFKVSINGERYHLSFMRSNDKINIEKHTSAIAANFIHSLDAAHTSKILSKWWDFGGRSFGAVHDSFAVHASDVDTLVDVIKETFIEMYDDPNFYQKWVVDNVLSNTDGFDEEIPKLGELDLNEIYQSDYFFS